MFVFGGGGFVLALSAAVASFVVIQNPDIGKDLLNVGSGQGGNVDYDTAVHLNVDDPAPVYGGGGGGGGGATEEDGPTVDPNLPAPVTVRFDGDHPFNSVVVSCPGFAGKASLRNGVAVVDAVPKVSGCKVLFKGGAVAEWPVSSGIDITCDYHDKLICS